MRATVVTYGSYSASLSFTGFSRNLAVHDHPDPYLAAALGRGHVLKAPFETINVSKGAFKTPR
ncbi:hypothetical protein, partial [Amycolatopsis sp. NPDC051071]|uniref:hypothetical protein n=1 Tax=Amycolatopsis sp. NPDC051071 TaxID=3154637 RepID=UPI00344ADF1B